MNVTARTAASKGKMRRAALEKQRQQLAYRSENAKACVRRKLDDVPPVPDDGETYVYAHGGRIVDKGLMRWRFDNHGKLIAWFLYAPEEERARGAFSWVEIWTDGKH